MSREEREAAVRQMGDSLAQAIADAERSLADGEAAEIVRLAELAVRGIHVVRWNPPGPAAPVCDRCGRTGGWYQWVESGVVRCECTMPI